MVNPKAGQKAIVTSQPKKNAPLWHAFKVGTEIELSRSLPLFGQNFFEFTDGETVNVVSTKFFKWL
tara:strand:- start:13671 stop:13868 length:198 start_codon:yes stop_codon:yes gene_type:complete